MKFRSSWKILAVLALILFAGCIGNGNPDKNSTSTNEPLMSKYDPGTNGISSITPISSAIPNSANSGIEKIEIIHFHGTNQCYSCVRVGELAEKAVNTHFSNELKSGKVVFKHVNGELPENSALTTKYGASGSSLWIGTYMGDGKFNAEQNINVWYKLNNENDCISYLKTVIEEKLAQGKTNKLAPESKTLTLGFCPTMTETANHMKKANSNIRLEAKSSTSDALAALSAGEIDIALVGRIAKQSEIGTAKRRMIGSGHTLVGSAQKTIQLPDLSSLKVHTALDETLAKKYLPNSQIIFHDSLEDAISKGIDEAVLIDWNDFKESMELVIVMGGASKVKEFRIPVLYTNEYDLNSLKIGV